MSCSFTRSKSESGVSAHPRPRANAPAPPTYSLRSLGCLGQRHHLQRTTNRPAATDLPSTRSRPNHSNLSNLCLVISHHLSHSQHPQPQQPCLETITTTIPSHCKLHLPPHLPHHQSKHHLIQRSSPQGRIFQIEYAAEAVKLGSVVVGIVSKTHAVMCAVKVSSSKLSCSRLQQPLTAAAQRRRTLLLPQETLQH